MTGRMALEPWASGAGELAGLGEAGCSRSCVSQPRPEHVAIIMDGNGRWGDAARPAARRGHREGVKQRARSSAPRTRSAWRYLTLYGVLVENLEPAGG